MRRPVNRSLACVPSEQAVVPGEALMHGDWRSALHAYTDGAVRLIAEPDSDPVMIWAGAYQIPDGLAEEVAAERRYLQGPGRYNETQALLAEPLDPAIEPIVMRYRTIEYAAVRALRRRRANVDIVSASVLPVCWETRHLYLQRRADTLDLAPSRLHCFAGAFQPPSAPAGQAAPDRVGLVQTALRELEEETRLNVGLKGAVPMALFKDQVTASLELVLLGLPLQSEEAGRMQHSHEGDVLQIGFDEFPARLRQREEWTLGSRFVALTWLALCAARRADPVTFAGTTPMDAFWHALG